MSEPTMIAPCPFCGTSDVNVQPFERKEWAVTCAGCGARGPLNEAGVWAETLWNDATKRAGLGSEVRGEPSLQPTTNAAAISNKLVVESAPPSDAYATVRDTFPSPVDLVTAVLDWVEQDIKAARQGAEAMGDPGYELGLSSARDLIATIDDRLLLDMLVKRGGGIYAVPSAIDFPVSSPRPPGGNTVSPLCGLGSFRLARVVMCFPKPGTSTSVSGAGVESGDG